MSTYSDSILSLIPSGIKAGKLYSLKPTDGSGDFTVTRATTATRVNAQGLIETVGINVPRIDYSDGTPILLTEPSATNLYFPSDLGKPTLETGQSDYLAPDGTNTAYYPLPVSSSERFNNIISAGIFTTDDIFCYSWYRKRTSLPYTTDLIGDLDFISPVNYTIHSSPIQIESDVNGYDRFRVLIRIINGALGITLRAYYGSIIGVGNQSVAYWGHQLEQGSTATSYIPTAGSTVTRSADVITVTPPSGVTSIIETIDNVEQTPITVIPSTYTIPNGNINKIVMQ